MKRVGVAEFKKNLSRHLRAVQAGEEIELTVHERPVARVVPVDKPVRLTVRAPLRPFEEVNHLRFEPFDLPVSSTELLRQDRDIR